MKICLQFSSEQNATHRRRLEYAFRVFCAVYGNTPLLGIEHASTADISICYGPAEFAHGARAVVRLSNLYRPRLPVEPAPPPNNYRDYGESTALIYAPLPGQTPDWLGEIFEWLSCADEYSVRERDSWQRVPFNTSYVGRHLLDGRIPYAATAMRILNLTICQALGRNVTQPPSPSSSVKHFVIPTHDIDYFPVGRTNGLHRLLKNAAVSLVSSKDPALAIRQIGKALQFALGKRNPMDQIQALSSLEQHKGVTASYYFLPRCVHPRDANYSLETPGVIGTLRSLTSAGMEIGVHGTYSCLERAGGLADEYRLARAAGFPATGGRQHWLRFTLDRLISSLESAGACYDTSLGWADRVGYRGGACFAFPPYNFEQERAANFLEIPMIVMDVALRDQGSRAETWYSETTRVLSASRRLGWGGISLLWHPTAFGGGWLAPEAGEVFSRLLTERSQHGEAWLSARDFLKAVRQRYADAGLMPHEAEFAESEASPSRPNTSVDTPEFLEPSRIA